MRSRLSHTQHPLLSQNGGVHATPVSLLGPHFARPRAGDSGGAGRGEPFCGSITVSLRGIVATGLRVLVAGDETSGEPRHERQMAHEHGVRGQTRDHAGHRLDGIVGAEAGCRHPRLLGIGRAGCGRGQSMGPSKCTPLRIQEPATGNGSAEGGLWTRGPLAQVLPAPRSLPLAS